MSPKDAADGLIFGFSKIDVEFTKTTKCALYACERILGQHPQLNKDGTDNVQFKFWLEAYNYIKENFK